MIPHVALTAALGLTVGLVALVPSVGRCDAPKPRVHVAVDGCGQAEGLEIQRILGIELRAELGEPAPEAPSDTTNVAIVCHETTTELRVVDPITGKSLVRTIDLGTGAAKGRARLIALAASELVSASWTEMELTPRPAVPPAGKAPSPAAVEAARHVALTHSPALAPRSLRVLGTLAGFARTEGGGPLLGGGLRIASGDGARPWGFALDVLAEHASDATTLGSVSIDSVGLAPALLYHRGLGRAVLFGGAGVSAGLARLTGEPSDPNAAHGGTRAGPWLGPLLEAGLYVPLPSRVRVEATFELVDALATVTGKVESANVGLGGPWLGLILGVGFVP